MTRMDFKLPLRANAAFSLFTGSILAIAPHSVDGWLGTDVSGWLRALGVGLLGHGIVLFVVARRPDAARWGWINVAMVAPYPLAMVALVATDAIPRSLGQGLAIADGVIVGAMAAAQFAGLRTRLQTTERAPQPELA